MIRAVIFDLDGTLVNTLEDIAGAVNFVLEKRNFPVHETKKYKTFVGNGHEVLIKRALPPESKDNFELVSELKQEFLDRYGEHYADKSLAYNGITELLKELKRMKIKVAVVTNKAQKMTNYIIPKYFGKGIFSAVIGQRDSVPAKPEPHMPFMAMSKMNVNPDECLFVGDSCTDMQAGTNSGNVPVGVLWGFREREELEKNGARYIVSSPGEIIDIIREINQ
ncbi:MAG: HAD family hydrolase [Ruminococcaceae bacterium]|nr:HAD family hydrolase [Oscillospiraceae bacterium]